MAAASKLMANMVYNYKGMGLSMGMMLAGVDKRVSEAMILAIKCGNRTPPAALSVGLTGGIVPHQCSVDILFYIVIYELEKYA